MYFWNTKITLYLSDGLGCSPGVDFEIWHRKVVIFYQEKNDLFPPIFFCGRPAKTLIFFLPGP